MTQISAAWKAKVKAKLWVKLCNIASFENLVQQIILANFYSHLIISEFISQLLKIKVNYSLVYEWNLLSIYLN